MGARLVQFPPRSFAVLEKKNAELLLIAISFQNRVRVISNSYYVSHFPS